MDNFAVIDTIGSASVYCFLNFALFKFFVFLRFCQKFF